MERLSAEDAVFLDLEDDVSAMHSVTVATFAGPKPPIEQIRDRVRERMALMPRFRERVLDTPLGFHRPVWVDAPNYSLSYHLRHTGLPEPTEAALANLIERILAQRLDRTQPLWELWVVSGLADGQWAVVSKAHHAMIDGVSGVDPLTAVVDQFGRAHQPAASPDIWKPRPLPSAAKLTLKAATALLQPTEQVNLLNRMVRPARRAVSELTSSARTQRSHELTMHRRWRTATVDRRRMQRLRKKTGGSTNDVLLALVASGFAAMAEVDGGIWADERDTVKAVVPYAAGVGGIFTNEITSLVVDLPVGKQSLQEAVDEITRQTEEGRDPSQSVTLSLLSELDGLSAPTLASLGVRKVARAGYEVAGVDTVVIDGAGPSKPVTFLGCEMASVAPAIPLAAKVRVSVGIMSYRGNFTIAITGDREFLPQVQAFADALRPVARR